MQTRPKINKIAVFASAPVETQPTTTPENGIARNAFRDTCASDVALAEKADNSPEDRAREMEKQVNKLIEQSAEASAKGEYAVALETAKDAVSIARI